MSLNKSLVSGIDGNIVNKPSEAYFNLPEKVLQFGTGVLLRGLPDYFIDKANKQGIFNGRIVVVKSTATGGADEFATQDGLYTLAVRGLENGNTVNEFVLNAAISRVVAAGSQWAEILEVAKNPELQVVISNTTEVGIVLVDDDIFAAPPKSFPGKLTAVLYERYKAFNGAADKGLAIVPTEMITDNGKSLKSVVFEQAKRHNLEQAFIDWLENANEFCNTLVDRIVPGKLTASDKADAEAKLGYKDDLIIMSEVYRLWAIETEKQATKDKLSFSQADSGVVLTGDISKFKELKLRLLNGSHTFTCGWAIIKGFSTVKEAMANEAFFAHIKALMNEEIIPAITSQQISEADAQTFAASVLDRYANPFLEHLWINITAQYSLKIKGRCLDILNNYYERKQVAPNYITKGFAAYIRFMKSEQKADDSFVGTLNGKEYTITDQYAELLHSKWNANTGLALVKSVLEDVTLWDKAIVHEGFAEAVNSELEKL